MRGRFPGLGPELLAWVVSAALAFVVLVPGAAAQSGPTGATGAVTTTAAPTTTAAAPTTTTAPTTTAAVPTSLAPTTTAVAEEEPVPVVTTTRRPTTTLRASTTTGSSTTTSTTVAAAIVPSTTRPATITSLTLQPDTSAGNQTRSEIDRIVRLLFGIAGIATVLGLAYAWYTSPRWRVKVSVRKAALASQRLDDAMAASFVGTTFALGLDADADADAGERVEDDPGARRGADNRADDGDESREGLASTLLPRSEDDVDDPSRPNPRPDPRPRPNDSPWES